MVQIFTDTSANLPYEFIKRNNIAVLPFSYTVDGEPVEYDADTEFDGAAFYNRMREGATVKTSMVNVDTFINAFEPLVKNGDGVLYVGMSGGISGTAGAAAVAAREIKEKYPAADLECVDTKAASLGEGLLVIRAVGMINAGKSAAEAAGEIRETVGRLCQYFTVDDLNYLKNTGRICGAVAFIANMLSIKPLLRGDDEGHIVLWGKQRGKARALSALANKYDEMCSDKSAVVGIAHADDIESANKLESALRECGFSGECLTVCYEPVTGSHVGPGTVALFFYGNER